MRSTSARPAMPLLAAAFTLVLGCSSVDIPGADSITSPGPAPQVPVVPQVPSGPSSQLEPALPELLTTGQSATPSTGRQLRVARGGDLQQALDTARYGDIVLLAAGATYAGNYVLPAKTAGTAGEWITVRTDGAVPAEGTRMTPAQASALNLPKIQSATILPAIRTAPAAARWRVIGVEVTTDPTVTTSYALIALGDGSSAQATLTAVPTDLIFDRVYVHGLATLDVRRCFAFNSARTAVIDSYVSECHSVGFDAQAIAGWNGPGPYKIVGNYLEGSTEVVAFGGADPAIPSLVPSDIEIRRNHITKPTSWKGQWLAKNLVEFKAGRRVLIEANVMENSWPDGQVGPAVVLWSVNPQGSCTWCVTEDLTFRNNLIRNVMGAFQLTATGASPAVPMRRVAIRDNLFLGINPTATPGFGRIFQIIGAMPNLIIEHNTAFSPTNSSILWSGSSALPGLVIRNNLMGGGEYQLFSAEGQGQLAWNLYGGSGSEFAGNVVALAAGGILPLMNSYPASLDDLSLTGGKVAAYSGTASPTDLALAAGSPFKGKATDGRDPGADIATLVSVLQGVVLP